MIQFRVLSVQQSAIPIFGLESKTPTFTIYEMSIRIVRWVALVSGLVPVLLAPLCAYAEEKSHVTVEHVDKAIREVEKLAQKEIQENAVPGLAIAVVFQDKLVYAKGFGVRDVKTKAPVDADTVFQLASVSKPIGSTVVAELVGEGKVTAKPDVAQANIGVQVSGADPKQATADAAAAGPSGSSGSRRRTARRGQRRRPPPLPGWTRTTSRPWSSGVSGRSTRSPW